MVRKNENRASLEISGSTVRKRYFTVELRAGSFNNLGYSSIDSLDVLISRKVVNDTIRVIAPRFHPFPKSRHVELSEVIAVVEASF